ncbi:MAG: glycine cleavage system aminomethyltransferase GcvT [Oscillospiraceae bacterium]|nr:glycine cleavage system aminomethyltransferase GcvT [Oscillospiraceae bacterium]
MERKTPLYDTHLALGGKIVSFAGYQLPIQYKGITEEHMATREKAGLFDVSHMGEFLLTGPGALASLNNLCCSDLSTLAPGRVRYTLMLNSDGGTIDDLLVYCLDKERYWMVVNAGNMAKDYEHIKVNLAEQTTLEDISDTVGQIALQGPASAEIIAKLASPEHIPEKYYSFIENANIGGVACLISRTGYTGSFGYELYCKAEDAPALWQKLTEAGADLGVVPCGLGARNTLRLEAGMPLYGHELTEEVTPLEAGLTFAVKMEKTNFIGKSALSEKGEPKTIRAGLKITGQGIARENCPVLAEDREIGAVTSGTHLPYMNGAYAMALIEKEFADIGTKLIVDVRGRKVEAVVVALPFYTLLPIKIYEITKRGKK